ncbi:MAG: putative zinc-binding peptidase [Acidobacteriota bacterium]
MNVFHCDWCDHLVFFENTQCVQCGHVLAYLPDVGRMGALDDAGDGFWVPARADRDGSTRYRLCANYTEQSICNWTVPDGAGENPLCTACRLTSQIPDLSAPGNHLRWYRLEVAKRRLLYTLMRLELPITSREASPSNGLAFEFLADVDGPDPKPVLTGHADGVITINVAEADEPERERRRVALHEPYRTLLGHFRHEIGHYYWDVLVRDTRALAPFRRLFGDEQVDYAAALRTHYTQGAAPDWPDRFVSAYAASHPWEDWAETWAHYLHICDSLETAAACGISIRPPRGDEPAAKRMPSAAGSPAARFDQLMDSWFPLTYVLNNLNRGLGLPDGYPFVLTPVAIDKLRFVHDVIANARVARAGHAPPMPAAQATCMDEGASLAGNESSSASSSRAST